MSKKTTDVQPTLDNKVFVPYKVVERKLTFSGGSTITEKELGEKGPGLERDKTYLFMIPGKLAGASLKFGNDGDDATVSIKLGALQKYEVLEVPDILDDKPKDIPRPAPEPEAFQPSEIETNEVLDAQNAVNQVEIDRLNAMEEATFPSEPEESEEEEDTPEEPPAPPASGAPLPQCYTNWEVCPECESCECEEACRIATAE
jgi:hypothetical protein